MFSLALIHSLSPLYYFTGLFALLILILTWWLARTNHRLNKLLSNGKAQNLEETLSLINKNVAELRTFTKEMEGYLLTVEYRLKKSTQHIEIVRYNPFKGTGSGGNNSFSAAFLNETGDGIVLTSLYSRERVSVFGKPVKNFTSEYELSDEELESINKCKKNLPKQ